jgi:polysaccharide export outer membrane protein
MNRRLIGWMTIAMFLAGCAQTLPPLPSPTAQSELSEVIAQRRQLTDAAYTLGPDDVLRITVFDHPDLSHEATVGPDGALTYPLVGKFHVAGLSVEALEQQLVRALADGYVVKPQVSVTVTRYRGRHVYVIGAVRNPGVYPLQHNASLLEFISQAGGVTPEAGWSVVLVRAAESANGGLKPTPAGQENAPTLHIDLDRLFAGQLPQPIRLASGDTIYVPQAGYFFVSGQVNRPGRYRLERGMTVEQAVVLAGGFTRFAAESRLRIKRVVAGQPGEFQAQPDDRLQADDVLIVPESIL